MTYAYNTRVYIYNFFIKLYKCFIKKSHVCVYRYMYMYERITFY